MIYHTPMSTVGGDKRIYHTDKDCRHLPDDPDGYYEREEPVDGWELCKTCEGTEPIRTAIIASTKRLATQISQHDL